MNRDSRDTSCRWVWLVLAAVLLCVPARAQCQYDWDGETTCYSTVSADSYGNLSGISVTEVPWWWGMYGYYAYVEGILTDGSGYQVLDDVTAWDDGVGHAEADTNAWVTDTGSYNENAYHWFIGPFNWYLGDTQASTSFVAPTCDSPYSEYSTVDSISPPGSGVHGARFYAYLIGAYPQQPFSGTVWENVTRSPDGCWFEALAGLGIAPDPSSSMPNNNATWTVDSQYGYGLDTIAESAGYPDLYRSLIVNGQAPYQSCPLFQDTQVMSHSCTGNPYKTNVLGMDISADGYYTSRDNAGAVAQ